MVNRDKIHGCLFILSNSWEVKSILDTFEKKLHLISEILQNEEFVWRTILYFIPYFVFCAVQIR